MYCKTIFFFVIETTLATDNPLRFRKNLLERIQKFIMTIDDKIKDEKLQYDLNKEAARLKMENCNMIITEKLQKYQNYR